MEKIYSKFIKWKIDYLSIFFLMLFYYGFLQWNRYIGDPDGFYHAKIALFLSEGRVITSLPWMQFSTLKESFTDHHFLYHLAIVPFIWASQNPLIAVKIATVFFAALMTTAFYFLLKSQKIAWPYLFTLLFITLIGLNFRLHLVKANGVALLFVWLIIYALFSEKKWLLFIFGFLFVWLYGGWPVALVILAGYLAASFIYQKINSQKAKVFFSKLVQVFEKNKISKKKLSLYLLTGLVLGIIINPYWPHNLYFYWQQVVQIGLINQADKFGVGSEWYGASISQILSAGAHLFIINLLLLPFLISNHKKISKFTWFGFIMAFGFIILNLKSRRYIEYSQPFLLLFTASAVNDVKQIIDFPKIKNYIKQTPLYLKIFVAVCTFIFLVYSASYIWHHILNVPNSRNWPIGKFEHASYWLKQNTPQHSIVLHTDWDEWPVLFYYNDHNYYIVGLDPTFMENYDSQLHKLYRDITTGEVSQDLSREIFQNFGAKYIFVEIEGHQPFIGNLNLDQNIDLVYQDEESLIYKISP